jgi:hypothetical protein
VIVSERESKALEPAPGLKAASRSNRDVGATVAGDPRVVVADRGLVVAVEHDLLLLPCSDANQGFQVGKSSRVDKVPTW